MIGTLVVPCLCIHFCFVLLKWIHVFEIFNTIMNCSEIKILLMYMMNDELWYNTNIIYIFYFSADPQRHRQLFSTRADSRNKHRGIGCLRLRALSDINGICASLESIERYSWSIKYNLWWHISSLIFTGWTALLHITLICMTYINADVDSLRFSEGTIAGTFEKAKRTHGILSLRQ